MAAQPSNWAKFQKLMDRIETANPGLPKECQLLHAVVCNEVGGLVTQGKLSQEDAVDFLANVHSVIDAIAPRNPEYAPEGA